ncbi:MAG: 2-phospho-L-lactate transferase CofD family protein [Methanomicrobiaceae archaeon]|nr:2-phospho-L-lactate transferase CofD family protein [Methanomicrobiaceae archaeon]
MITFLAGGGETCKLIQGLRSFADDSDLAVIAGTADGMWVSGNYALPALDAVLFLFSGMLGTRDWSGIRGDSCATARFLQTMGRSEPIIVGDRERAVHIARSDLLAAGLSLTAATEVIAGQFGIASTILPMSDDEVHVAVECDDEWLHLLEYECMQHHVSAIQRVVPVYTRRPRAGAKALACLAESRAVVIGPDNPVSRVLPFLCCEGMREALEERFVIALSPFSPRAPHRAEIGAMLTAEGFSPDSAGVRRLYGGMVDVFVQDVRDPVEVEGAMQLNYALTSQGRAESLAWDLMAVIRQHAGA